MRILVTGGCGFIGSHVCEYYINKGAQVIAFDNMTKHELSRTGYSADAARDYTINFLKKSGVDFFEGDICNSDELNKAARDCDYIVHTAAQPAMTISIEAPNLDFNTNLVGTFNVLETARKFDIPIVSCATIHVYGNKINETLKEADTRYIRNPPTINEDHPTAEGIITPLHASKSCGDLYIKAYIDTYGLEAASYRLTGLYGPRQFGGEDHGWVANFTIRNLLEKPITIYGTGKQVRDILFASDVVEAFHAFYKARKPGIYNIGGGIDHSISLIECIQTIEKITGKKSNIQYSEGRLGDLLYFVCDTTKAEENLGWKPKTPPEKGISLLAAWVKDNITLFRG
ncbi:MAG: GDP-L-fucose synthase [Candidatus Methanoperedenaceae archaeon GB50]|nr:MAG: GDP-L-fucose synthase [Candidatus Methanoperedenaceae archaeon GB50]